jgi:polyprenyl P-hydroxybenzoate/phenylacrylic acid decarboxylase-like protein
MVVAITGATGAMYGVRALEMLRALDVETHLVLSRWGRHTIDHETTLSARDVSALASHTHAVNDLGSTLSSGSFRTDGMLVAPCSVRTLSAIAVGLADDLITRAADVTLKERRRLVLMVRETPLSAIHLHNMSQVTAAGGIVFPPVPSLYTRAESVESLIDYTVARALDLFGFEVEVDQAPRWSGLPRRAAVQA